ncbi:MAG TPA: amidase [Streptosporangiaceae bacterium]|nr:amidase [Streptosporangiaceae bacterium]
MDHDGGNPTWIVRVEASGSGARLAVKDCIDVAGLPTTVGCPVIAERAAAADRDAAVVAAARRAGAQILGKTNLAELCWSALGTNAWSGTPVNPADPRRVPGGSSSGSAVAVATGEADVALGTDTGGSVRIPAACCGVAGLKTTWGRVPVEGVYPLARSMDTVGPLGADVAAVERGMRLIEPGFTAGSGQLPVARVRPETDPPVDPAVEAAIDAALTAAGIVTTQVAGLDFAAANTAGGVLIGVEAYQVNGYLLPDLARLSSYNQRNLPAAAAVNAGQEAAANRTRDSVRDWFAGLQARHPVLALPTLVGAPPVLGDRAGRIPLTLLTMPANLAGLPALALPVPGGPAGLPASLQLVGPPGGEEELLALGYLIEAAVAGR